MAAIGVRWDDKCQHRDDTYSKTCTTVQGPDRTVNYDKYKFLGLSNDIHHIVETFLASQHAATNFGTGFVPAFFIFRQDAPRQILPRIHTFSFPL